MNDTPAVWNKGSRLASPPLHHRDFRKSGPGVRFLTDGVPEWHEHAACVGHAVDFLNDRYADGVHVAKRVCASCPVVTECLTAGMGQPVGVWGGMTTRERRALAKGK